jgi:hypothetical protein
MRASSYVTTKVLLALAESAPSEHVTSAVEVPGLVLVPTFHVHETEPDEPATGAVCSPAAVDTVPEAYVTLALQLAPGEVTAISVALAPCPIDAGRLVMRTENEVTGGDVTTGVEGCAVTRAVGAAVAAAVVAGFVGELVSAIP